MIVYFLAFFITLLFCFLSIHSKKKLYKNLFIILSFLPFFIVSAIRYNVGIDTWLNYGPTFENVALYGDRFDVLKFLNQKYEFGFSLIMLILSKISKSSVILFAFCSGVFTIFTFLAIYKQSKLKWLSIIILFFSGAFLLSMNGMRNYMAIAISLFSLKYIYEHKPFKFILCILLAASIHKSVLLLLVLYPLYNIKMDFKILIGTLGISIVLTFFINDILSFLLSWTSYGNYFTTDKYFVDPLYTMLIINLLLLALFLYNYPKNKNDKKYNFYLKLQLLSLIVCIFSFRLSLTYRLEQIIDFFQIITVPYNIYLLYNASEEKRTKPYLITIAIIMLFGAYFAKVFILSDDNQVRDYVTIFNKGDYNE